MKSKAVISAIMAVTMSMSGLSFAQGNGDRPDKYRNGRGQQADQQEHRDDNARRSDRRHDRRQPRADWQMSGQRQHSSRQEFRNDNARRPDRRYEQVQPRAYYRAGGRGHAPVYIYSGERGAGPDHAFRRGGRLPQYYRSRQYVVEDWHGHHLSAPPRGYHWVQTGGDYVLIAIATGVIVQLLLNSSY